jgi:hypothetical protein
MRMLTFILLFLPLLCHAQIPDRSLHIGAGMFAGSWGSWVGSVYTPSPEKSFLIGMGITSLVGLGKEGLDHTTGGRAEFKDFTATITGGLIGAGLIYFGRKIFKKKNKIQWQNKLAI